MRPFWLNFSLGLLLIQMWYKAIDLRGKNVAVKQNIGRNVMLLLRGKGNDNIETSRHRGIEDVLTEHLIVWIWAVGFEGERTRKKGHLIDWDIANWGWNDAISKQTGTIDTFRVIHWRSKRKDEKVEQLLELTGKVKSLHINRVVLQNGHFKQ